MQFKRTTYLLFVCVGFIVVSSLITGSNNVNYLTSTQPASILSSFLSIFSNNRTPAPVIKEASVVQQVHPSGDITPVPPGTFGDVVCKDSGCDTGSGSPITITNGGAWDWDGTWPESLKALFKQAIDKRIQLEEWLATKCTEPGCELLKTGPEILIKMRPNNPVIGSCKVQNTRHFTYTSTKTSTVSCKEAEGKVLEDIGKQMSDISDPCPQCGYDRTLSNISIVCTQTPPPVTYKVVGSIDEKISCTDKGGDTYKGWIEWNSCFCCKATTPPPSKPNVIQPITPPLPKQAI